MKEIKLRIRYNTSVENFDGQQVTVHRLHVVDSITRKRRTIAVESRREAALGFAKLLHRWMKN